MAVLVLDRVWVNLLSSGAAVSGRTKPQRPSTFSVDGDVLTFAGGRQRAVTNEGEQILFSWTFVDMTLDDRDQLRVWQGLNVIVRDHRGQWFTGVYLQVDVTERETEASLYEISLSLRGTTTAAGV